MCFFFNKLHFLLKLYSNIGYSYYICKKNYDKYQRLVI